MTIAISSQFLSIIIIIVLVMKINFHVSRGQGSESDEWDLLEIFVAVICGWLGIVYILISYTKYIFMNPFSKVKKKSDSDENFEDVYKENTSKTEDTADKKKFSGVR